ncbi:hypothetical protein MKW92_013864 [Papaver armeniacum]|nr:hypothetical protein MKW92_013864 [Papaver armeniacum]
MGFFAIYKEAYKLTAFNKKIFLQITSTVLFPLAIFYFIHIHTKTYPNRETSRWIAYGITQFIYLILLLFFTLLSTSSVIYTIACFYTSKDITYKKATGVLRKCWGRLIVTFLWCFFIVAVYTFVALCLFVWFFVGVNGSGTPGAIKLLIFVICLSLPFFTGLIYMIVVWNIATAVTVLEKDYGRKALAKSMRLIAGKIWVSCAVFGLLEIAFAGIIFTFAYLVVVDGNKMSLVGKIFVGIACYLLMTVWIHFSLVVHTVVYFVCKS